MPEPIIPARPITLSEKRSVILFWFLLAGVIFVGLTLFSRHVPEEWTLPVKGLSGLVAGLFALFGLKLELKDQPIFAALRFTPANVSRLLAIILVAMLVLLISERLNPLRIVCLPGTEIWIDGKYERKVLPPEDKNVGDELRPMMYVTERVCLKWGNHEIVLKKNPLCPGREETFREEIRIQDALFRWRKVSSIHDRQIETKMQVFPLFEIDIPDDGTDREIAQAISAVYGGFWERLVSQSGFGKELSGTPPDDGELRFTYGIDSAAKPILEIGIQSARNGRELGARVNRENKENSVSLAYFYAPIPDDGKALVKLDTRTNVAPIAERIWSSFERHLGDDDLCAWIKIRLDLFRDDIGGGEQVGLVPLLSKNIKMALEAPRDTDPTSPTGAPSPSPEFADNEPSPPLYSDALMDIMRGLDATSDLLHREPASEAQPEPDLGGNESSGEGEMAQPDPPPEVVIPATPSQDDPVQSTTLCRVYYNLAEEWQRKKLTEVAANLDQETAPESPRDVIRPYHWRKVNLRTVPPAAYVPQKLEVRYYLPEATASAKALLEALYAKGLKADSGRISRIIPTEYDLNTSADLKTHLEVWTSEKSFIEHKPKR